MHTQLNRFKHLSNWSWEIGNKGKFRGSSYWLNTTDQQATRQTCAQPLHNSGCSGQPSGLLFQKTMGAVTTGKKPTGGGERISASHTRGDETRNSALEEDHSRLVVHAQTVVMNAMTRMWRNLAAGEDF